MTTSRSVSIAAILVICLLTTAGAEQNGTERIPLKILAERLASDDAQTRKEAAEELESRSAEADDGLRGLNGLSGNEEDIAKVERFRNEAKPLIAVLIKLLSNPHEESRVAAALVLGAIGPDAEASRPALRRVVRDAKNSPGLRYVAAPALLRVTPAREAAGREFLEGFLIACGGDSNDVKVPDDDVNLPEELESTLGDDETFAGWYGPLLAMLLIAADRTSMEIPFLLEVTPAEFPKRWRLTAIAALFTLEDEAQRAVPALRKLLDDDDPLIRQFAGLAIVHITGDPAEIAPIVKAMSLDKQESRKFLDEANSFVKHKKDVSRMNRENGREHVLFEVSMLNHRNSFHQRQAIRMLGEIGPEAKVAVPELKKLLKSKDEDTRTAAAAAIKKIDAAANPEDR